MFSQKLTAPANLDKRDAGALQQKEKGIAGLETLGSKTQFFEHTFPISVLLCTFKCSVEMNEDVFSHFRMPQGTHGHLRDPRSRLFHLHQLPFETFGQPRRRNDGRSITGTYRFSDDRSVSSRVFKQE